MDNLDIDNGKFPVTQINLPKGNINVQHHAPGKIKEIGKTNEQKG